RRARGLDARPVDPSREVKSVSAETTFDRDLISVAELEKPLWRLCEKLGRRLKEHDLAAGGVILKLKTAQFVTRTRAAQLPSPTVLPDRLFELARVLLAKEATGTPFRLIGVGASPLVSGTLADHGDLADSLTPRRAATQAAIDILRARFGEAAVTRGRALN
ncbi:MAG TPA: DNA polymerase IV, partial [Rhodopila sp.]|nr:DNA polymerase IV [Rhodopila sp.]